MLSEQHKDEIKKYNITEESIPQLMTSIAAISVFPFAARGILEGIFESVGIDFNAYMEQRKKFAADFVIRAIKKSAQSAFYQEFSVYSNNKTDEKEIVDLNHFAFAGSNLFTKGDDSQRML